MAQLLCPLPQIEDALRPYIRTRSETLLVRQSIAAALQDRIGTDTSLTQLTLGPVTTSAPLNVSLKSDGVHQQFFAALAAHRRAQMRYESAKADLDAVRKVAKDEQPRGGSSVRDYVDSVRQKRQAERMEVVQRTLTRLDEVDPHPAKIDVKAVVKAQLGPPPDAPQRVDQETMKGQIDELAFQLKKALLQAKAALDTAESGRAESVRRVDALGSVNMDVRVEALRRTRDELIRWIEEELAKVEEEEEEVVEEEELGNGYSGYQVQGQVQSLYERYVSAREALIGDVAVVVDEAPADTIDSGVAASSTQSPTKTRTEKDTLSATELLKYLPSLVQSSRDEASLLQQTAFLRKQLNLASTETKRTVQRLAGESHLVPPDTTDIRAWDAAADESTDKTREFVHRHVQDGKGSIGHAREVLANVQAKRSALGHLRGNV